LAPLRVQNLRIDWPHRTARASSRDHVLLRPDHDGM